MSWHIIPTDDLEEHIESSTCECSPWMITENGEMIFIHNSYDGREFKEQLIDRIKTEFKLN